MLCNFVRQWENSRGGVLIHFSIFFSTMFVDIKLL
jgi:hypothetical protein